MPIIVSPTSSDIILPVKTFPLVSPITTVTTPIVTTFTTPIVTALTTPVVQLTPYYKIEVDTGLNDSWLVQKQANDYLLMRILDHWIHESEMRSILKFMVIEGGKVRVVKSMEEYEKNDVTNDKLQDRELKSDFIEENLLNKDTMRKILIKIINELGYRWQFLSQPKEEHVVVGVTKRYLKKKFRQMMGL
jgi:hypothetical protein